MYSTALCNGVDNSLYITYNPLMGSFRNIIDMWRDRARFAADVGVKYQTARQWYERDNIPVQYWLPLIRAAREKGYELTTETLLELSSRKARTFPMQETA